EQTVSLLNFQQVGNRTFSGQLAFNVLGDPDGARRDEALIAEQYNQIVGGAIPLPGLMSVQVPVFHSQCFAVFTRLIATPSIEELENCLREDRNGIVVYPAGKEYPSPVTVVGTDKFHIGRIGAGAGQDGTYSIWIVADNLRIAAANALQTAESLMF